MFEEFWLLGRFAPIKAENSHPLFCAKITTPQRIKPEKTGTHNHIQDEC